MQNASRFILLSSIIMMMSFILTSCYSYKKMVYLQSKEFTYNDPVKVENSRSAYIVQPNDVLSILVQGPESNISQIFNISKNANGNASNPSDLYLGGYSVDDEGYITLPVIGKLLIKNKRLDEVQEIVQQEVNNYLNNATVLVKLVSFKITILGEVNKPGYHYVYNGQLTILEALGLAGDLTRFGKRSRVKLIRQTQKGTEVILLDLNDADLISSKYYYLQPNDVIYVEPIRAETSRVNLSLLNLLFSAITTSLLVLNFVTT